ncbi:vacuolar protein sorting-associated protein 13D isoform X3 [Octopus sinensis]|uniref:Vacuolar protein sorting-associated protein 13D isoform X3 n=1 Tax=Octopus sinensis TaxID=2607531 RepID=A0A7E6ENM3_9MOLL|nr:vacuolar protein sorting-associated protein 13D isoform X3 [Octopus sinensis]
MLVFMTTGNDFKEILVLTDRKMLNRLAAWIVNNYIGEYVENLNRDSVYVGLLAGAVQLDDLILKKDVFNQFGLPLQLKKGMIRKITLKIPVTRIHSEPWVITMEGVYIIVEPMKHADCDKIERKKLYQSSKQLALETVDDMLKQSGKSKASSSSWLVTLTSVASNILENLQLHVNDVHIRYEDSDLNPSHPFAVGIDLDSLIAQSTDENWVPCFVYRNVNEMMFKLMELNNLSLYFDTNVQLIGDLPMAQIVSLLQGGTSLRDGFDIHDYVLSPTNARSRIQRNTSELPLTSASTPRLSTDITIEELAVSLSNIQYKYLVYWTRELDKQDRLYRCLKWRPDVSCAENPRRWWDYAITGYLFFINGRQRDFSVKRSVQRARDLVDYYKAYCAYLTQTNTATMIQHQKKMEDELNIEEIKTIRLLAFDKVNKDMKEEITKPSTPVTQTPEEYKTGYLQSWLSWAVGYSEPLSPDCLSSETETPAEESIEDRENLERELMDIVNKSMDSDTFYKRDKVFATLNFCLKKGSMKLLTSTEKDSTIREMLVAECNDININVEARPQVGAYKFCLSLGIFELQDRLIKESCFPSLIVPNPKEISYTFRRMRFGKPLAKTTTIQEVPVPESGVDPCEKIFEVTFEKSESNSNKKYRIYVKTKSIAIVCNPYTVKELKDFFTVSSSAHNYQDMGQTLTDAAYKRYQNLKFHTKTELQNRWRELLQGKKVPQQNRIEIKLDIAAPKIIVPESFFDQNTTLVVFDLGYLSFQNATTGSLAEKSPQFEDQDEEFLTPSQSPPNELELSEEVVSFSPQPQQLPQPTAESMNESFYERYQVILEDLQVLVGQTHDNWKAAHSRGNTRIHLLDKFSIEVLFERRVIFTTDPEWPSVRLSGTLPSLTIHADQKKVKALSTCMNQLSSLHKTQKPKLKSTVSIYQSMDMDAADPNISSASYSNVPPSEKEKQQQSKMMEASVLLEAEFSVNKLSLEINSRGRPITELQVDHVQGRLVKKYKEMTTTLTVHSLLLVDGLQTFGKDYELLAASHKNLSMDSQSGKLRGSESQTELRPSPVSSSSALSDHRDEGGQGISQKEEALITLHIQVIASNSPNNPTNEKVLRADIQFNSLDVIANQETLTEIMSFFHSTMKDMSKKSVRSPNHSSTKDQNDDSKNADLQKSMSSVPQSISGMCIGVTADFHRLNILLVHLEDSVSGRNARKVATITMSNAQINARISEKLEVAGSLEGFHIVNVMPEAHKHQYLLQVGKLSTLPSFQSNSDMVQVYSSNQKKAYQWEPEILDNNSRNSYALTFQLERYLGHAALLSSSFPLLPINESLIYTVNGNSAVSEKDVAVKIRMASVIYIHSPLFLRELSECLSSFKDYTSNVASSIKHAAKEVAKGLVAKRMETASGNFPGGNNSSNDYIHSPPNQRKSESQSLEMNDFFPPDMSYSEEQFLTGSLTTSPPEELKINIDMQIETPIVFLPRKQTSSEVLMACLGEISIKNMPAESITKKDVKDCISIHVDKMSLYALNLTTFNIYERVFDYRGLDIERLFKDDQFRKCNPVLYDTNIEITLHVLEYDITCRSPCSPGMEESTHFKPHSFNSAFTYNIPNDTEDKKSSPAPSQSLSVNIVIATPCKLVLSKAVYEQILETRHNLTLSGINEETVTFSISSEGDNSSSYLPGISALKLDSSTESDIAKVIRTGSSESTQSSKPVPTSLPLEARFEVAMFSVEMQGDLEPDSQKRLVDLCLQDLILIYHRMDNYVSSFDLSLKSLTMEDLLETNDSKPRYLMVSSKKEEPEPKEDKLGSNLSTSCPDCTIMVPKPKMPGSLPSSFHEENVFMSHSKKNSLGGNQRKMAAEESNEGCYPCTPPPSPMGSMEQVTNSGPLVHISIFLVDSKCPQFQETYKQINRSIDIQFSSLDTTINLQTWVVLLDFLGLGATFKEAGAQSPNVFSTSQDSSLDTEDNSIQSEEVVNSKFHMNIESLTLIMNKPEYELARATVSNLKANLSLHDGNTHVVGQLGSISVLDQSPYGLNFREKFISVGDQALTFDIFKYAGDDPGMQRAYDLCVKLHMATVQYTYTDRFQSEVTAFCMHFLQLHDRMGRIRAASIGKKISASMIRNARIKMNIEADSPVILLPYSYKTTGLLVAELGRLSVTNQFLLDGSIGTIKGRQYNSANSTHSDDKLASNSVSSYTPMTQSVFHQSLPKENEKPALVIPKIDVDLMNQSIYGSLEHDIRDGELEASSMSESKSSDIFDPTENVSAEETVVLSTLECLSPCNFSVLDSRVLSDSSSDKLSSPQSSKFCKKLSAPLLAQEKKTINPFTLSVQQSMAYAQCDPMKHICLLDVMSVTLTDMDLYSAELVKVDTSDGPIYSIERDTGKIFKEKCALHLQVERNLDRGLSHSAPNIHMTGKLSSIHALITLKQFKLLRGILAHNIGETLPDFQRPFMTHLKEPQNKAPPSGSVWTNMLMEIDLRNITVELLFDWQNTSQDSLARFDFIHSNLLVKTRSNGTKDVDLVSHEIRAVDTRYKDLPPGKAPNVFSNILQPSKQVDTCSKLQMELYFQFTNQVKLFTVLLNNMRLMCIFDWLLAVNNFLTTDIEDPFLDMDKKPEVKFETVKIRNPSESSTPILRPRSPLNRSQGIVTRRCHVVEQTEVPFELKVNVRNTQFVVVADMSTWDTEAAILKCTAVLRYRPKAQDLPLSCSLQSLEVFSCFLMEEEETALSIIDPTSITIEINANPLPDRSTSRVTGLLDAQAVENPLVLEMTLNLLNIRLSYNDLKMFIAITDSLPEQATKARTAQNIHFKSTAPAVQEVEMLPLGESSVDALPGLNCSSARSSFSEHSYQTQYSSSRRASNIEQNSWFLTGIEIKASSICICLIDDCKDADVPLAEISFNYLELHQQLLPKKVGRGMFKLLGDYYNRKLSGWEPFIEVWKCNINWEYIEEAERKLELKIDSMDCLNINLTSAFIDQYTKTRLKWTEDYYKNTEENRNTSKDSSTKLSQTVAKKFGLQKRIPFVPFVIRNHTGLPFHFLTVTTTPACVSGVDTKRGLLENFTDAYIKATEWKQVEPNEEVPFFFQRREKIRHKETHELRVNQLVVKADGWQKLSAVTVDKVGIYFRDAQPDEKVIRTQVSFEPISGGVLNYTARYRSGDSNLTRDGDSLPHEQTMRQQVARFVFDVTQEGSARKMITVRSALTIVNKLHMPVEVVMYPFTGLGCTMLKEKQLIQPNSQSPVPILYTSASLCARPADLPVEECGEPLYWDRVRKMDDVLDYHRVCRPIKPNKECFRFCVSVRRGKYPEETQLHRIHAREYSIPGHIITLHPPVTLCNLLPIEMSYYFKNTSMKGQIDAGKQEPLYQADMSQHLELGIQLENFRDCNELMIPPGTINYKARFELYDSDDRMLALTVRIISRKGGALKLQISAPYWLVNKSGIPLIFKQDGTRLEAAGQSEDHERAKSVTPLLFSFTDKECPTRCSMRAGRQTVAAESVLLQWCPRFTLDSGIGTRQVHITSKATNSPNRVFTIGIEVKQGCGMYCDTNIVTFAPRYCIDNQSQYKLSIIQQHFATEIDPKQQLKHSLIAPPKSSMPFHWPRVDFDPLLCVKVLDDSKVFCWSGGFRIDKVDSFHINIRDEQGNSLLLKVEVILLGPTLHVLFYNSDDMPPPFRIDNYSLIPVQYQQAGVTNPLLKQYIKPITSLPYAWDEPILNPYITLGISGGTSATYNMNKPGEGEQLCYQNFIFLAATSTFNGDVHLKSPTSHPDCNNRELVLDAISTRIVFKRKELGKRSQLWRMTGEGMLENEGSAPPQEPGKVTGNVLGLVLDISDIAPQPGKCVPLILRKPDERRRTTQLWKFTRNGLLTCANGTMCVQAVDTNALQHDAITLLGPIPSPTLKSVPFHMQISRQKQRPGSGFISVTVLMDGPVRVLHISDIQKTSQAQLYASWPKHLWYAPGLRPGADKVLHCLTRCGYYSNTLCAQSHSPSHFQNTSFADPNFEDLQLVDPNHSSTDIKHKRANDEKEQQKNKIVVHGLLSLPKGVGISLVNRVPEELVYIVMWNIVIRCNSKNGLLIMEASIGNVQIDNQLFSAQRPVMLSIVPSKNDVPENTPALHMVVHKNPSQWNVEIFKHLIISVRKVKLHLEEMLLLKLLQFTGYHEPDEDTQLMENAYSSQSFESVLSSCFSVFKLLFCDEERPVLQAAASPPHNKRYFFGLLRLNTHRISLSMLTAPTLPPELKAIKNKLSLRWISFEDATVDLDAYVRQHVFETSTFLINEIKSHYTDELKSQAAKILGSIDFLGNPLGLFNDFTEGISGLIKDGNFGGLLKNVTHGVSNSTAKVTSSLSDGLTIAAMDEKHLKKRTQILSERSTGHSSDHLKAGCKSLVIGLVGGLTSVVNQTYEGTRDDGFGGFFTGLSKGLVGTVIKPVTGVLDFATAAATAARETSRRSYKIQVRIREPRCCHGLGGLLPNYNVNHAKQQRNIHLLNSNHFDEFFIAWEQVRKDSSRQWCALITNKKVYFLMCDKTSDHQSVDYKIDHRDIQFCMPVSKNDNYYVKFVKKNSIKAPPYIRCDSFAIAQRVSQQILYALGLHEEIQQTLTQDTMLTDYVD